MKDKTFVTLIISLLVLCTAGVIVLAVVTAKEYKVSFDEHEESLSNLKLPYEYDYTAEENIDVSAIPVITDEYIYGHFFNNYNIKEMNVVEYRLDDKPECEMMESLESINWHISSIPALYISDYFSSRDKTSEDIRVVMSSTTDRTAFITVYDNSTDKAYVFVGCINDPTNNCIRVYFSEAK